MTKRAKTGGRIAGTRNKKTAEALAAQTELAAKLAAVLPGAFDGDAHALLIATYKDPAQPMELRIKAALGALPYEKPRLASVELTGNDDAPLRQVIEVRWLNEGEADAVADSGNPEATAPTRPARH